MNSVNIIFFTNKQSWWKATSANDWINFEWVSGPYLGAWGGQPIHGEKAWPTRPQGHTGTYSRSKSCPDENTNRTNNEAWNLVRPIDEVGNDTDGCHVHEQQPRQYHWHENKGRKGWNPLEELVRARWLWCERGVVAELKAVVAAWGCDWNCCCYCCCYVVH